jgi:hypothetical protein
MIRLVNGSAFFNVGVMRFCQLQPVCLCVSGNCSFEEGPITVTDTIADKPYCVLLHESRDFFGIVGEFAISPDISQMFGEVHLHGLIASRFMTKGFYGNLNILLDL